VRKHWIENSRTARRPKTRHAGSAEEFVLHTRAHSSDRFSTFTLMNACPCSNHLRSSS
jgi:hypothetical protein